MVDSFTLHTLGMTYVLQYVLGVIVKDFRLTVPEAQVFRDKQPGREGFVSMVLSFTLLAQNLAETRNAFDPQGWIRGGRSKPDCPQVKQ